jgi:dTDP-4-dehydrorhamnose 3,5-epimerase
MGFYIESEHLNGLVVLRHDVYPDERGFFQEVYREDAFQALGLPTGFVQENHSRSKRGVLRGLHFQWDPPVGKLMRVTVGTAYVMAVDIRKGSPTLGQWCGMELSANGRQVWAPAGFARGFYVLSEWAEVQYKCTGIYNPACESGIRWSDPALGIGWPIPAGETPLLSGKDAEARTLAEWLSSPDSSHFRF